MFLTLQWRRWISPPVSYISLPGTYDRENPDIESFKLYIFCKQTPYDPLDFIQATLLLTSEINLPFLINLADLELFVDGQKVAFTYVTAWVNNACSIRFQAPLTPGSHVGTFLTAYPIDLAHSSFTFSITGVSTTLILTGVSYAPIDARDVTIIKVSAEPITAVSSEIVSTSLHAASSDIVSGTTYQKYSLAPPIPLAPVSPAWFAFAIDAYHPHFENITCELSFQDTSGVTLWGIPLRLPNTSSSIISLMVPYSDWDDVYTLFKVLSEDIGWVNGTFTLTWNHLNGDTVPVALVEFTIFAADPSQQPITFTDTQLTPIRPILPVIWKDGATHLTFWSDESDVTN